MIDKKLIVFISYATMDSNKFQIAKVSQQLTEYPEIDDALFWEEDMYDDIFAYMDENLEKCDIFLLFCSANTLESDPIKMEWRSALKLKKKIIPVFEQEKFIPHLLTTKLGVMFDPDDLTSVIKQIYHLILKKQKGSKTVDSNKRNGASLLLIASKSSTIFSCPSIP